MPNDTGFLSSPHATETPSCPMCRKQIPGENSLAQYRPFCSARCQLVDLGKWLGEGYVIPVENLDGPTDEK